MSSPRPLRVLNVITDRDRRGAQVFAMDLGEGLSRLGWSATTVALAPGSHGDLLPIEALGPSRFSFGTLRSLRRLARQHDVVVAHGASTLPACVMALVGRRVPVVYRQISDPLYWAASWSRRLRVALMLRSVDHVVALSTAVGMTFRRHYWLKSSKVTVIPNAVPHERFVPPTPSERLGARQGFGLDPTAPVALYVGSLSVEKGVDQAIEMLQRSPSAQLLIVGQGPEREALERRADRIAPGRVFFQGPLDDPRDAYRAGDVLLLPSRGGDSMPAVLIESGLMGLPSVTTPVGAIADVVLDGQTGLVTPIDDVDALAAGAAALLAEPLRKAALGAAAQRHCANLFTIDQVAPRWIAMMSCIHAKRRRMPKGLSASICSSKPQKDHESRMQ